MFEQISEKRENFRMQIVTRQKQQFFRKKRKEYLQHLQSISLQSNGQESLKQLRNHVNINTNLQRITYELQKDKDGFANCVYKILDGKFDQIVRDYLENNIYVEEILFILSLILSSPKVTVGHRFIKVGIFQYLLMYIQAPKYTKLCSNILANLLIEKTDYSEIFLEQNLHKIIFQTLKMFLSKQSHMEEQKLEVCLQIIQIFAVVAQNSAENEMFQEQLFEIFQYCLQIFELRILIKPLLQIFYFIGDKYTFQTFPKMQSIINQLLANFSQNCDFGLSLFLLCKIYSGFDLEYEQIWKIMVFNPSYISLGLRIMKQMRKKQNCSNILRDEVTWQKICTLVSRSDDRYIILDIFKKIQLYFLSEWLFRFVITFLEDTQISHQTIALQYIQRLPQIEGLNRDKLCYLIQSSCMPEILQKIYEKTNSSQIKLKAQYVLLLLQSQIEKNTNLKSKY